MTEPKWEFQETAEAVDLLMAALDYIAAAQQRIGPSSVLDVAYWAVHYCLTNLNESDQPRN